MRIRQALGTLLCLTSALASAAASSPVGTTSTIAAAPKHSGGNHEVICPDDDGDPLIFHVTSEQRYALLSSSTSEDFASRFPEFVVKVRHVFDKEGVVVIRGLFDADLLDRLECEAQALVEQNSPTKHFTALKFGPVFSDTTFREAALMSAIPHFVAKVLLGLKGSGKDGPESLRVLKDAFLCKGGEKKCCGWHVDDWGFWPISARSIPGVNAWIALDEIPAKFGGGLAVSPQSHRAVWRHDAYKAICSTQIFPEEGILPGTALAKDAMAGKTCEMEVNAPSLAKTIDATKKTFHYKKGDILFHTRWIFHRSEPVTAEGLEYFCKLKKEVGFKRYSIRYDLGASAHLLKGIPVDFATFLNPKYSGKTLDEVCASGDPWYPKCWPEVSDEEMSNMISLVKEKIPMAELKQKEYFQKMGFSHSRGPRNGHKD